MASSESEPVVAQAPNTLEPYAHRFDAVDESPDPQRHRGKRSPFAYVGAAVAVIVALGSIALLTRSTESGDTASRAASQSNDSETMQQARTPDPKLPHGEPAEPTAETGEAAAPKPMAPEPETSEPDSASAPEPNAANSGASAVAESSAPASPGGPVTVTIHASPPEAIIYDEKQRIGKGTARLIMQPGRKRSMLALLNLHHPKHFVLDGSQTTVNVTLEPMDENAIARSLATQKHKATRSPTTTKRNAR